MLAAAKCLSMLVAWVWRTRRRHENEIERGERERTENPVTYIRYVCIPPQDGRAFTLFDFKNRFQLSYLVPGNEKSHRDLSACTPT